MATEDELALVLEEAGLGARRDTIFLGKESKPPKTKPSIQIIAGGGSGPEYTQNVGIPSYVFPSAKIVCRANDYPAARDLAGRVYFALAAVFNRFVASGWYRSIKPLQEPFPGGKDDQDLSMCTFNVLCNKRPTT